AAYRERGCISRGARQSCVGGPCRGSTRPENIQFILLWLSTSDPDAVPRHHDVGLQHAEKPGRGGIGQTGLQTVRTYRKNALGALFWCRTGSPPHRQQYPLDQRGGGL